VTTKILNLILIASLIIGGYAAIGIWHAALYDEDAYCCRHMGRDIEDILESYHIPVTIEIGEDDAGNKHLWFSIGILHIDSVTLLPCNNHNTYHLYRHAFNDYQDYLDYKNSLVVSI